MIQLALVILVQLGEESLHRRVHLLFRQLAVLVLVGGLKDRTNEELSGAERTGPTRTKSSGQNLPLAFAFKLALDRIHPLGREFR